MYPLPSEMIFNFHLKKNNYNPILLYEIKHLVAFSTWKRTLSTEHLYTVNIDNLFIIK